MREHHVQLYMNTANVIPLYPGAPPGNFGPSKGDIASGTIARLAACADAAIMRWLGAERRPISNQRATARRRTAAWQRCVRDHARAGGHDPDQ